MRVCVGLMDFIGSIIFTTLHTPSSEYLYRIIHENSRRSWVRGQPTSKSTTARWRNVDLHISYSDGDETRRVKRKSVQSIGCWTFNNRWTTKFADYFLYRYIARACYVVRRNEWAKNGFSLNRHSCILFRVHLLL